MNNRTLSAITLGSFLISLAIGLIVFAVTGGELTTVLWITMLIFGIALLIMSFRYSGEDRKFGPSDSIYRMTAGIIIAIAGLIGLLNVFIPGLSMLISVAIFLVAVALVGIFVAVTNGKKEGK